VIRAIQDARDLARLSSKKISLQGKERIRGTRAAAGHLAAADLRKLLAGMSVSRPVADYLARFAGEQSLKQKQKNDVTNERKRQLQVKAALARDTPG
jgi:hypothetical protein